MSENNKILTDTTKKDNINCSHVTDSSPIEHNASPVGGRFLLSPSIDMDTSDIFDDVIFISHYAERISKFPPPKMPKFYSKMVPK